MIRIALIFLFLGVTSTAYIFAQKPAAQSKDAKPAPVKAAPKIRSKVSLDADADCYVKLNGKEIGNLKSGKPRILPAFVGENNLEVTYGFKATPTTGKTPAKKENNSQDIVVVKTFSIPDTNVYNYRVEFFNNEQLNNYLRMGRTDMVELTLKNNPRSIKPSEDDGLNPLMVAIAKKDLNLLKILLDNGADPNLVTGSTPLNSAIQTGSVEVVKLLLAAGAKVSERGDDGKMPLEEAVFLGKSEVVKLLLEKGANPNEKDASGLTMLELATDKGFDTIVNELKKYGAK